MSTFAVFGMTEAHAKQMAQRLKPKYLPKQQRWETQSEYEARTAEVAEKYLDSERAVQVSPLFDAPQFCDQFMDLARRAGRSRSLTIRRRETRVINEGKKQCRRTTWHEYP